MSYLVKFGLPSDGLLKLPTGLLQFPESPFQNEILTKLYDESLKMKTPLTIAIVYFTFVHMVNPIIRRRQLTKAGVTDKSKLTRKEIKRLPAAPYPIAKNTFFKIFVLLHNIFLCLYSAWSFISMISSIRHYMAYFKLQTASESTFENFFQSVCDINSGVFSPIFEDYNLKVIGWWFYISKFYEVIDTLVILLKGRPSSLLQSYHHAGAMMCMWGGIRFQSPPIWIFVVFNSLIHSLMYFYFSLSCLKIRVPNIFKRTLTTMQITQFVVGGSLAVVHAFIWYTHVETGELRNCISNADQALPLYINVIYLTPLTALFAAFYIESYMKRANKK